MRNPEAGFTTSGGGAANGGRRIGVGDDPGVEGKGGFPEVRICSGGGFTGDVGPGAAESDGVAPENLLDTGIGFTLVVDGSRKDGGEFALGNFFGNGVGIRLFSVREFGAVAGELPGVVVSGFRVNHDGTGGSDFGSGTANGRFDGKNTVGFDGGVAVNPNGVLDSAAELAGSGWSWVCKIVMIVSSVGADVFTRGADGTTAGGLGARRRKSQTPNPKSQQNYYEPFHYFIVSESDLEDGEIDAQEITKKIEDDPGRQDQY